MDNFNVNLDSNNMVQPTDGHPVVENGVHCPNCENYKARQLNMSNNAAFLLGYCDKTDTLLTLKNEIGTERDQLKKMNEENRDYIEKIKHDELNVRCKLSKALEDNQPLLHELNEIRKRLIEICQQKEEANVRAASSEATLKQVQQLLRQKDEEIIALRHKCERVSELTAQNNELTRNLLIAKNKIVDLKEKNKLAEVKEKNKSAELTEKTKLAELKELVKLAELKEKKEKIIERNNNKSFDFEQDDSSALLLHKLPKVTKEELRNVPIVKPKRCKKKNVMPPIATAVLKNDAQNKVRENWSGGKPSTLETLVRPPEVRPRFDKKLSPPDSCSVIKKIGEDKKRPPLTNKNETSAEPVDDDDDFDVDLSTEQILAEMRAFLRPPLSPIRELFEKENKSNIDEPVMEVSSCFPLPEVNEEESSAVEKLKSPNNLLIDEANDLPSELVIDEEEEFIVNVEINEEEVGEPVAAAAVTNNNNFDDEQQEPTVVTNEKDKNLFVVEENFSAPPPKKKRKKLKISYENKFEKQFFRTILGQMSMDKQCYRVGEFGKVEFSLEMKLKLFKLLKYGRKCDAEIFNSRIFKKLFDHLTYLIQSPDESLETENIVHQIIMTLFTLGNFSSAFSEENAKSLLQQFSQLSDCKRSFVDSSAVRYALWFCILRYADVDTKFVDRKLDELLAVDRKRLSPDLMENYKQFKLKVV